MDVVYFDFQKTFDKVPHNRLLLKVCALGIEENVAKWIENWLCGRHKRVVLNVEASGRNPVTSRVPQGSI